MNTPLAWLVPHLPTLAVDAHRGHETPMLSALVEVSAMLRAARPTTVVAVSARWRTSGPFMIDAGARHRTITDYADLGVEVRYDCAGDPPLARAIVERAAAAGVRAHTAKRGIDSGISVPMRFLIPDRGVRIVPVSVADRPPAECRAFGAAIAQVLSAWPEPVAFVVGGLLTFNEHAWRFGREIVGGAELDERLIAALRAGRWSEVDAERAAIPEANAAHGDRVQVEAGLRHLDILHGFLGEDVRADLRCYEPGPGAGAVLLQFEVPGATVAPPARQPDAAGTPELSP
jgi:aromatic ring-opening dioxygenase catalytic subunit (LigB family)